MNYLLIIIVAVLLISMMIGMARGLVKTFFGLFGIAAILLITGIVAPKAASYVRNDPQMYGKIENGIERQLSMSGGTGVEEGNSSETSSDISKLRKNGLASEDGCVEIAGFKVPVEVVRSVLDNRNVQKSEKQIRKAVIHSVAGYLTDKAVSTGSFAIVFIGLYILKWILEHTLGIIARLPVLSGLNHIGGAVGGLAGGLVAVWIIFLLITLTSGTHLSQNARKDINASPALTYMYENAPLIRRAGQSSVSGK